MQISLELVSSWSVWSGYAIPTTIDINCPNCNRVITLTTKDYDYDARRQTVASSAACPRCKAAAHFWVIRPSTSLDSNRKGNCDALLMYPPSMQREPIEGVELVPERIRRAYRDAVDTYNAGLWGPSLNGCRRTLEGVVKQLDPDGAGLLAQRLKKLPEKKSDELAKPLFDLSDTVKEGGNLGSHFDDERDATESVARDSLDLVEYLLEYIYTVPKMIEDAKERLKADEAEG